jgi:hypothetical protein
VYLALGAATIIVVLLIVIFAAVVLLEQLAIAPDPSEAHAGVPARFALIRAASRIRCEGHGYDTIGFVHQYLTRILRTPTA